MGEGRDKYREASVVLVECSVGDMAENITWGLVQESSPLGSEWSTESEILTSLRASDN